MIKKDKLNIDSFTTKSDKNYRQAEEAEKSKITEFFLKNDYNVLDIQQLWRHVHGKLEKDGQNFFFKMASTPDIGERTQNEVSFNKQIHGLIKKNDIDFFNVPKIFYTGEFENKFYYLSSHHDGSFLATKNPPNTERLDQWIDKIVKSNLFLLSLKDMSFYRDKDSKRITERWNEYLKRIGSWHEEVKEHQLQVVFDTVKDLKATYEPGINHGDFVSWHMIQEREKFILIDAEHASSQSPKYYDICYFYHRLYTSAHNPDIAKEYLNKIRDNLPDGKRSDFDDSIKPILASRIIGGFWDAKTDGLADLTHHQNIKKDFLSNNLY